MNRQAQKDMIGGIGAIIAVSVMSGAIVMKSLDLGVWLLAFTFVIGLVYGVVVCFGIRLVGKGMKGAGAEKGEYAGPY